MRRRGFTLIELLISTALAMMLASVATGAFLQLRQTIARAQDRLATHASVESLYTTLKRSVDNLQQSCGMVAQSDAGQIRLIFMRAKMDSEDYRPGRWPIDNIKVTADLVWEEWRWDPALGTLTVASSSPLRSYRSLSDFTPATVNLNRSTFLSLPQPRRYLDPTAPTGAQPGGLDDNIYFPTTADPTASLYHPEDVGDYTDMIRQRTPIMRGISALTIQLVAQDGTVLTLNQGPSVHQVIQGVWLDGRMAPTLSAAPDFATGPVAKRPVLLRLRFTAGDAATGAEKVFSFSFPLPGLAGEP